LAWCGALLPLPKVLNDMQAGPQRHLQGLLGAPRDDPQQATNMQQAGSSNNIVKIASRKRK